MAQRIKMTYETMCRVLLLFLAVTGYEALPLGVQGTGASRTKNVHQVGKQSTGTQAARPWTLGPNPEEMNTPADNLVQGDILIPGDGLRSATFFNSETWACGQVPFTLSSSFPESVRAHIRRIMEDFSPLGVSFVDRSFQWDWLAIQPGATCSSHIGRRRGEQPLYLSPGCYSKDNPGSIHHELMHAIGFYHEHSRADRDNFVNIHLENATPGTEENFDKADISRTSGQNYDYDSVMHYSIYAFSATGQPTITSRDPTVDTARLGQRLGLSDGDKAEIKAFYSQTRVSCTSSNVPGFDIIPDSSSTTTEGLMNTSSL